MKKILIIIGVLSAWVATAQNIPGEAQNESILILGGTVHIGNGDKIEVAALGFENGKITLLVSEKNVDPKDFERVLDGQCKHIYPGMIAMNSTLGLFEIGAVRATRDDYEVGEYNPNIRSVISFNTESDITMTVRSNGVLLGQITPRGGTISGSSSLVHFDAWNWEDAALKTDEGIHMNWPSMYRVKYEKGMKTTGLEKKYKDEFKDLTDFFSNAKAYAQLDSVKEINVKYEAMKGVFQGRKTLYVHANNVQQISAAVNFKKEMGIAKMVIVGGYDSWMVADLLRENNVAVMLRRVHSVPSYSDDDYDLPYKIPKLLQDEGVLFCLENAGDMEQMGTRNLPFYAGSAVAYGLTYEQAVQSLTLSPAKILGVDDTMGSLEVNKDATFCLLYTSPSPRDRTRSRMPSSA